MKHLNIFIFAIFFSLMINNKANAQGFGVRAGANSFEITNDAAVPEIGYYGSVFYQIGILPKLLYIQPELQFSKQSFSIETNFSKTKYDLNYIQVPILARAYFLKILSFETGPQFGALVSDNSDDVEFKSFDPSWTTGMSLNLLLGLSIDVRYTIGFDDIVDESNVDSKIKGFQFGAAFKF